MLTRTETRSHQGVSRWDAYWDKVGHGSGTFPPLLVGGNVPPHSGRHSESRSLREQHPSQSLLLTIIFTIRKEGVEFPWRAYVPLWAADLWI